MNKPLAIFLLFCGTGMLEITSCKHEPVPVISTENTEAVGICFESDVLPLFQSYCAKSGCHSSGSHKESYILDSYANIIKKGIVPGNSSASNICLSLTGEGNPMPPVDDPQLTNDQVALIKKWIDSGAVNTTACSNHCDSNAYKYTADIKPLLNKYCTGCHGGNTAQAAINLDGYATVKDYVNTDPGRFLGSVIHDPGYSTMPKYAAQLSDCNITKLKKWIAAGAPND